MTKAEALKYLHRAIKRGYVRHRNGLVVNRDQARRSVDWGFAYDGDGSATRPCDWVVMMFDATIAETLFPAREKTEVVK